jgi:Domain of Unknown Function (DUF1080)
MAILLRRFVLLACLMLPGTVSGKPRPAWQPLFNGKDLSGWTVKIRGYPLGENYGNTFRVEGGLLKVAYDRYGSFDQHFGHLAWKQPLSRYRLRIEYRFVGQQAPGGPSWALRNSGVMLHGQPPATMSRDQKFPVSLEVQFLGGTGGGPRPTANVCTPGTHIVIGGQLITKHCTNSKSATYDGDRWVTVEVEVDGGRLIRHLVDGQVVLEYSQPQLDDKDADARPLLPKRADKQLRDGYIYLQAESHPVEFRRVEMMPLE